MLLLRSLLFNLFLYTGIVVVFLIALPTLFLPSKFTLFFGKLLGHYVIFVVKIFLNTQVEIKGADNIDINLSINIQGCTDIYADNYNEFASTDNDSCVYSDQISSVYPNPINLNSDLLTFNYISSNSRFITLSLFDLNYL